MIAKNDFTKELIELIDLVLFCLYLMLAGA